MSSHVRWAIVAVVVVAIAAAAVGLYAIDQPSNVPCTTIGCIAHGNTTSMNTALLSPDHAAWFFAAAAAVLVVGMIVVWAAASAGGRERVP